MGKAKKSRGNTARGVSNSTARPLNTAENAANKALRESKILPVVKNLGSANPRQRSEAVTAITNLLEDANCRRLLLKERVVQKLMEEMLSDSNQEVIVYGWGALRNIAAEEGYDQSIFMYRKDILTPAAVAIKTITSAIENITRSPSSLSNAGKRLLWQYAENVVGLITSLSETSQEVIDAITKMGELLHFLMSLLNPSPIVPRSVQEAAAQCLHALTEENVTIIERIFENENYLSLLLQAVGDTEAVACLRTTFICGTLHNISLAVNGSEERIANRISDSVILPILTGIVKSTSLLQEAAGGLSLTPLTLSSDQRILAVQTALEILASIATAVQGNADGAFKLDAGGDAGLMDEDGIMKDEDGEDGDGVEEVVLQDMDMVVGDESNGVQSIPPPAEDIVRYLIGKTAPILISIAKPGPGSILTVQTRALSVLNNISWTVIVTISRGSPLWSTWGKVGYEIWDSCVSSILAANTADIELADAVAGLSWAVAKSFKGNVDVSHGQHRAFISLYHAANSDELRTKCVGVLGCLGLPQGRIEINKEIGVFMMTLIAAAPNTPAEPIVEAINAILDIYADAGFDYDEPVFVRNSFLAHLSKSLPNFRSMVKKIDKRKFPEDRYRADEAVLNLQRFIQYKSREERGSAGGA